jgi:hypothetical protein
MRGAGPQSLSNHRTLPKEVASADGSWDAPKTKSRHPEPTAALGDRDARESGADHRASFAIALDAPLRRSRDKP